MALQILLLLPLAVGIMALEPRDVTYCHEKFCPGPNTTHIGCNNANDFHKTCKNPHLIPVSKSLKNLILTKHNNQRNRLAMGFAHFSAATRMATLCWSNALAYLTELNVKRCQLKYSECTHTVRYPNVGQNIAINKFRGEQSVKEIISSQISMWFDEYHKADMACILKGLSPEHIKRQWQIKHFLQLARDSADRIGCAIARYKDEKGYTIQQMTCLYNVGVGNCFPIYQPSNLGGKDCQTGINNKYPFLCNEKEEYNYIPCPSAASEAIAQIATGAPETTSDASIIGNIFQWYNESKLRGE